MRESKNKMRRRPQQNQGSMEWFSILGRLDDLYIQYLHFFRKCFSVEKEKEISVWSIRFFFCFSILINQKKVIT